MVAEAPNESLPNEPTTAEGIKVAIYPEYPEQTVTIGESLSKKGKMEICDLLRSNLDIFAWKPSDMTGVPRSIAKHPREAVSAVLLTERDSQQMPVYFVSRALQAPEINYSSMEKLVPRTSIRGQVLADFIAERPDEGGPLVETQDEEAVSDPWTLFTDGSSCREGSGSRLILTNPKGIEFTYALRFEFEASNNEAEYEALVAGLHIAEQMGVENLEAKVDSRLVANQINESYVAKEQSMIQNLEKAKTLISGFKKFSIEQVSGSKNKKADALSKIASTSFTHLTKQVLVEVLKEKSIKEREILAVVEEEGYCWMTCLLEYLTDSTLPAETKKARAIKIKSRQCALINGVLYRK
ncbi:reverse transcriptase domain-containing protein [Tanacetum coccineum]